MRTFHSVQNDLVSETFQNDCMSMKYCKQLKNFMLKNLLLRNCENSWSPKGRATLYFLLFRFALYIFDIALEQNSHSLNFEKAFLRVASSHMKLNLPLFKLYSLIKSTPLSITPAFCIISALRQSDYPKYTRYSHT